MEKKFKFSDKATVSKIVYAALIAVLCVSAIVVGIVVANNRKPEEEKPPVTENPPVETPPQDTTPPVDTTPKPDEQQPPKEEVKLTFVSPAVGTVSKSHSTTVPVFSNTLDEWRIHTGIDITTDEGADVFAMEKGTVTKVYSHPQHGYTVEITHDDQHKSVYSNLAKDSVTVSVGTELSAGAVFAKVGDSSILELADEAHLHLELFVGGESKNPLDFISEESKSASLGITNAPAA